MSYMYKVPLWEGPLVIKYFCGRGFVIHVRSTFVAPGTGCHNVPFWRGFVIHVQSTFVGGTVCHRVLFLGGDLLYMYKVPL